MKKIAFGMIVLIALSFQSKAQVTFSQTASNPTGAIVNNAIDTMTITLTKGYNKMLVGVTYTRTANTAAGTAILEYRLSPTDNFKSDAGDTLTVSNLATQTLYWNKGVTARYWRIRVGGATTVTASVVGKLQTD